MAPAAETSAEDPADHPEPGAELLKQDYWPAFRMKVSNAFGAESPESIFLSAIDEEILMNSALLNKDKVAFLSKLCTEDAPCGRIREGIMFRDEKGDKLMQDPWAAPKPPSIAQKALGFAKDLFGEAKELMQEGVENTIEGVGGVAANTKQGVVNVSEAAVAKARELKEAGVKGVQAAAETAKDNVGAAYDAAKGGVGGGIERTKSATRTAADKVKSKVGAAGDVLWDGNGLAYPRVGPVSTDRFHTSASIVGSAQSV